MRCTHDDCFTCPYPDCVMDSTPRGSARKRSKLSPTERKIRKSIANKKYYEKNQSRFQALHREYYRKKKEAGE